MSASIQQKLIIENSQLVFVRHRIPPCEHCMRYWADHDKNYQGGMFGNRNDPTSTAGKRSPGEIICLHIASIDGGFEEGGSAAEVTSVEDQKDDRPSQEEKSPGGEGRFEIAKSHRNVIESDALGYDSHCWHPGQALDIDGTVNVPDTAGFDDAGATAEEDGTDLGRARAAGWEVVEETSATVPWQMIEEADADEDSDDG